MLKKSKSKFNSTLLGNFGKMTRNLGKMTRNRAAAENERVAAEKERNAAKKERNSRMKTATRTQYEDAEKVAKHELTNEYTKLVKSGRYIHNPANNIESLYLRTLAILTKKGLTLPVPKILHS